MIRVFTLCYLNSSSIEPRPACATPRFPYRLIEVKDMAFVATSGVLLSGKCTLLRAKILSESILAASISVIDLKSLAAVERSPEGRRPLNLGKFDSAVN